MYLTHEHKTTNTFAMPLQRAMVRLFSYMATTFQHTEQPQAEALCRKLSGQTSWSLHDAADLLSISEPMEAFIAEPSEDRREEILALPNSDATKAKYVTVSRAVKDMDTCASLILIAHTYTIPGLHNTSAKHLVSGFARIREQAEFSVIAAMKGGTCRCGCSFSGTKEEFIPVAQAARAAGDAEAAAQISDLAENLQKFSPEEVVDGVIEALEEDKAREDEARDGASSRGGNTNLADIARRLGLSLPGGIAQL